MAKITLDHSKLDQAAAAIETYVATHRADMKGIDAQMENLGSSWQGPDYAQVKYEWGQMKGYDSVSDKMLRSLEAYRDFLKMASGKYKQAQIDAVNRAKNLNRW